MKTGLRLARIQLMIFLCGALFSCRAGAGAQSVLIKWNPAWDNNLGFAAAPVRPPIAGPIIKENGTLTRDGREFILFGTGLNEASAAMDTDYKIQKTVQRIAAQGFNAIRLLGLEAKDMTTSASDYGCWANATGPEFSETYMTRLDKTIAWANSLGLQIWIAFDDYYQPVTRVAGLPTGTYDLPEWVGVRSFVKLKRPIS
jgi:hypothetical protein